MAPSFPEPGALVYLAQKRCRDGMRGVVDSARLALISAGMPQGLSCVPKNSGQSQFYNCARIQTVLTKYAPGDRFERARLQSCRKSNAL